jgi:TM2 domain-containing membrane protein YozV
MHIRTRKFVGTFLLLALVTVWSLLAMGFAQFALSSAHSAVVAAFYVIAGLGWVLPAMPLVAWMVRPDKARTD